MSEKQIDLRNYFNGRIFFPDAIQAKGSEHYLDWDIASCDDIFGRIYERDGVRFRFQKNERLDDHIFCSAQELELSGVPCRQISFAGFSMWGFFRETFHLKFREKSEVREIFFADLCNPFHKAEKYYYEVERNDYMQAAPELFEFTILNADVEKKARMYHATLQFSQTMRLEKIVLPDNMLMKIMAITVG